MTTVLVTVVRTIGVVLIVVGATSFVATTWFTGMMLQLPDNILYGSPVGDVLFRSLDSPWVTIMIGVLLLWGSLYLRRGTR